MRTVSDEHRKPKEYSVTYVGGVEATLVVPAPSLTWYPQVRPRYRDTTPHGITVEDVQNDKEFDVEVYKVTKLSRSQSEYQKHKLVNVTDGEKRAEKRQIKSADYVLVKTQQPLATWPVSCSTPCEDGLTTWNYFDEGLKEGEDFPVLRVVK